MIYCLPEASCFNRSIFKSLSIVLKHFLLMLAEDI